MLTWKDLSQAAFASRVKQKQMSGAINNWLKEILDFSVLEIRTGIEKYAGNRHEKTGKRKKAELILARVSGEVAERFGLLCVISDRCFALGRRQVDKGE
ncbi:hypothetical protein Ddc_13469 [Ditylenchus destructor]|nr:hypothetical protein Ddc_13469 [Ditylenchus destructor]